MRKRAFFILLILLFAALLLPACGEEGKVGSLAARMDGSTLVWDACSGAASYGVTCKMPDGNGYSIGVKETSFLPPHTVAQDYLYVVTAKDKKGKVIARSAEVPYHLGVGGAFDPIEVSTADELLSMKGSTTITFGSKSLTVPLYYRLIKDIDLSGKEITPIGNSVTPFRGVFEGGGHKITGISFTKCNTDGTFGLFGAIKNGEIKNVTLENAEMRFDENSGVKKSALSFGLLVGSAETSVIDNCHVTGNIDVLSGIVTMEGTLVAGGIVGSVNNTRVSGCSFQGSVAAQYGKVSAGGIVGEAKGSKDYDFILVNCKADATVNATGTAYNPTTGKVSAEAYAGVLVGNVSHAGRAASLLATGSATAKLRDGGVTANKAMGVFGRTNDSFGVCVVPIYNLFYAESIPLVSGTATSLGNYADKVHKHSDEALKDKESYRVGEEYGLDFEIYWRIEEGGSPSLLGAQSFPNAPMMNLFVKDERTEESFDVDVADIFPASYYAIGLEEKEYGALYSVGTILSSLGVSLSTGDRVSFSAEGCEEVTVTMYTANLKCYFEYAVYPVYEREPDVFGGYRIINEASFETYDFTGAKTINITILPAESAEE